MANRDIVTIFNDCVYIYRGISSRSIACERILLVISILLLLATVIIASALYSIGYKKGLAHNKHGKMFLFPTYSLIK